MHTMSSVSRPATRVSRSKSALYSPAGSPIQSATDTSTWRIGSTAGFGHQAIAQPVLVDAIGFRNAALVLAKCAGQECRLRPHARGAAVDLVAAQRLIDQLFEPVHLLRLPAQVIVEPQHFGDEARPELKRQRFALPGDRPRGRLRDDVAFERGQPPWRIREALMQPIVQLVARRRTVRGRRSTAPQLPRGAARVGTTTIAD